MFKRFRKILNSIKTNSFTIFFITPLFAILYKFVAEPYIGQFSDPAAQFINSRFITNGFFAVVIACFFTVLGLVVENWLATRRALRARDDRLKMIAETQKIGEVKADQRARERNLDYLTGIFNSRAFNIDLQKKIDVTRVQPDKPISVIMLDFDGFGQINKSFGFEAGDLVISTVAQVINGSIRRSEFMYRMRADVKYAAEMYRRHTGGDEFLFLLQGNEKQALFFLSRLKRDVLPSCEALAKSALHEILKGHKHQEVEQLRLRFSAGTAVIAEDDSVEEIMNRVDACYWAAKEAGMGVSVVWQSLLMQWEAIRTETLSDGVSVSSFISFVQNEAYYSKTHPSLYRELQDYYGEYKDFWKIFALRS